MLMAFDGMDNKEGKMTEEKSCMDYEYERVDHPSHYQGDNECIDIMQAMFGEYETMAFCKLNVYKYRFRAGKKLGSSLEEDLKKATWYENRYMELYKKMKERMG
ncbi:MAG: DUF3310 domain-containing protein [Bacteroidales bacterium]|nr:DUF3310 domain-containing protein [Bacteroidales bacterium]